MAKTKPLGHFIFFWGVLRPVAVFLSSELPHSVHLQTLTEHMHVTKTTTWSWHAPMVYRLSLLGAFSPLFPSSSSQVQVPPFIREVTAM